MATVNNTMGEAEGRRECAFVEVTWTNRVPNFYVLEGLAASYYIYTICVCVYVYIYIHNLVCHCLHDKELRTGKHHTFIYLAALRGQAARPQHGTTFWLCPKGAWSDLGEVERGFKESRQSNNGCWHWEARICDSCHHCFWGIIPVRSSQWTEL